MSGLETSSRATSRHGFAGKWRSWPLESPIAEQLKQALRGSSRSSTTGGTYQKGSLLVLAWAPRKETRHAFVGLVTLLQKKLGLPTETPDVPIEELQIEKSDFPSEWNIEPREIVGNRSA